jgi:hypothetical protein
VKKALKHLFCAMLISTLLFSNLPPLVFEDANGDHRIGLEDAILYLQDLSQAGQSSKSAINTDFRSDFKNAIETFYLLARLKTVIRENNHAQSKTASFLIEIFFILPSVPCILAEINEMSLFEQTFRFHSIDLSPSAPPPETGII